MRNQGEINPCERVTYNCSEHINRNCSHLLFELGLEILSSQIV